MTPDGPPTIRIQALHHQSSNTARFETAESESGSSTSSLSRFVNPTAFSPDVAITCAQVHFEFAQPTELPPPLIQLIDVDFKYPGRDDFGLQDLNIGIDMGSRVAIVGPNGAGKTTLMNLLAGVALIQHCTPVRDRGLPHQTFIVWQSVSWPRCMWYLMGTRV